MTAHTCKVLTPGCYRCELNIDELRSDLAEVENEIVDLTMQAAEMQAAIDRWEQNRAG